MFPDITDLIGSPSRGDLPCLGIVDEVYKRMGFKCSMLDLAQSEKDWEEIPIDKAPPGAVLGVETDFPGFVQHLAVYLGWGLCLHATRERVEVSKLSELKVIAAYIHADAD